MDCSYQAVYASYVKFCNMIGQPILPFDRWMRVREDSGDHKDKAREFIQESGANHARRSSLPVKSATV